MTYKDDQKKLEQYFRDCDDKLAIDHMLRASCSSTEVSFYIHPLNVNGDTLDYTVVGDTLVPATRKKMNFGQAIAVLKLGKKAAREGWNGKGIFIELQVPDEYSKMTHPYIYIDTTGLITNNSTAPKNRVPWFASQTDILAEDWMIID